MGKGWRRLLEIRIEILVASWKQANVELLAKALKRVSKGEPLIHQQDWRDVARIMAHTSRKLFTEGEHLTEPELALSALKFLESKRDKK